MEHNGLDAKLGLGHEHVSVEPKNDLELVASEPMETRTVGFDEHNYPLLTVRAELLCL